VQKKCPICKKKCEWENNPYRPFCSQHCKIIDLGAWASDEYRIEGKPEDDTTTPQTEEDI
jgi:endogenous inhibitor of DNA gyrase (YacG/DUF329 family)